MKRICATALALALAAALWALPAAAVDIEYSGVVDSYSGEAAEGSAFVDVDRIPLGDCVFDRENRRFVYTVTGGEISSSVVSGMVVTDPVTIEVPGGMDVRLYRDGNAISANLASITQPGSYVLAVQDGTRQLEPLRFTIVGEVTGAVESYNMPDYFTVTEVLLENQPMAYTTASAPMSEEGLYRIRYSCPRTGFSYELNTIVDHTPPVLALEAVKDGVAKGPVDLSDLEPGAAMLIRQDGQTIANTLTLSESGSYTVIVQDEAGNTATYHFRIQIYFNSSSWGFFGALAVFILGLAGYVLVSRRRLRIR